MTPKAFYRNYLADNKLDDINFKLEELIRAENPNSVFEFGCGTGKNLRLLDPQIVTCGMDVSPQNIIASHYRNQRTFAIIGDEYNLGHLANFDVAFTCSVLDHIEDIDRIIFELKRIAPIVFLAETNDETGEYYFPHDYESYGFKKIHDFEWIGQDKSRYYIWKHER
jgi:SAM-dependent methyltransferase